MLRGNGYTVVANEDVAELDFPHVTELWWQDPEIFPTGFALGPEGS